MEQTIYTVQSVEDQEITGNGDRWIIRTTRADGTEHTFSFPHYTWAARSAEYGIDLKDIDTLLDVCLHDTFESIDQNHPDFVYNNHEHVARTSLFERVTETKSRHQVVDPNNFLQAIKDHHESDSHSSFHQTHQDRVRAFRKSRVS